MSRNEENIIYNIYTEIESKGKKDEFFQQLNKMDKQTKHRFKSVKDKWEYALYRINGGEPKDKY